MQVTCGGVSPSRSSNFAFFDFDIQLEKITALKNFLPKLNTYVDREYAFLQIDNPAIEGIVACDVKHGTVHIRTTEYRAATEI